MNGDSRAAAALAEARAAFARSDWQRARVAFERALEGGPTAEALDGLGQARKEPGKTRERTFYTLTERGRAALREWLARPSSFPRIQNEAAVRVLASDLADDPRVVAERVRAMRAELDESGRSSRLRKAERSCFRTVSANYA